MQELNTNVVTGLTDGQVKYRQKKKEIKPAREEVMMAQVRRNGSLMEIPAQDLVVGDIVEVKLKGPLVTFAENSEDYYLGKKIPAELRIIEADGFKVINDKCKAYWRGRAKGQGIRKHLRK